MTTEITKFLDEGTVGVIATPTARGLPRQSLVYYVRDGDRLLVSTLADRVKARDVRRSGWASLCVMGHERPYPSATFSATSTNAIASEYASCPVEQPSTQQRIGSSLRCLSNVGRTFA